MISLYIHILLAFALRYILMVLSQPNWCKHNRRNPPFFLNGLAALAQSDPLRAYNRIYIFVINTPTIIMDFCVCFFFLLGLDH